MKKFLLTIVALTAVVFASCSKTEVKNEQGWYTDYNACIKQAQSENKKVMLIVSGEETDTVSVKLKNSVFYSEEFLQQFSNEYLFCEVDISPSLFKAAKPPRDADKKAKKDSKKFEKILAARMRVVTIYGVQNTPTLFLLSPEGYVIKGFTYIPCESLSEFNALLAMYSEEINGMKELIQNVKNSSKLDKVKAIDMLYENTSPSCLYLLTDLMRQVPVLDSKNESGLVGKYVMAVATSDAMDAYMARKTKKVAHIYESSAKSKWLSPEQKQQQYYAAAFVVGSNTPEPEETALMIKYLEKAIEIDPESNIGKHCTGLLEQVKDFKIRQDEALQKEKEEKKSK